MFCTPVQLPSLLYPCLHAGWVKMQWEEIQLGMPQIIQQVVPLYKACIPWYNKFMAKLDLEFIEPKDASVPELLIGFEHGAPAYDQQLEAHWF